MIGLLPRAKTAALQSGNCLPPCCRHVLLYLFTALYVCVFKLICLCVSVWPSLLRLFTAAQTSISVKSTAKDSKEKRNKKLLKLNFNVDCIIQAQ